MKKISVWVPCYNEVGNVQAMAETLCGLLQGQPYEWEVVFTDNCSTDGTKDILRELASKDSRIKVLINSRNYGTDGRSGHNSWKYLTGDVIICIACDFQEPPELIPEFIKSWEKGYKVVCGQKTGSEEGRLKYGLRSIYYKIINLFSDTPQYEHISGITLLDREVLEKLILTDYDYETRFAIADMGYEIKLIPYEQRKRKSGKSSYNVWRYLSFAINSMIATSTAPLRLMTIIGCLLSILSFLIGFVYLIAKLVFWNHFQAGTAPILIGIFFLGAIQLFCLGILGEYIGAILRKVTKGPEVIISEKLNFDDGKEEVQV